ncbi:MAG: SusC/RagA family TonB-linked outer membrane protein [Bacteroidales bacterium]|nr:SusC/RagA family TonB-linked outer membrane protein [Bacteroidales bacterium]
MKNFYMMILFLFLGTALFSQNENVTGMVTDKITGDPLPGVNVLEKGTLNGSVTDAKGIYILTVSSEATLIFSFIGYENLEVPVGAQKTINVELNESSVNLDEFVVTALGIEHAKKTVGYSTQQVEAKELEQVDAPNIGSLLTGKVAGLTVNNPTGIFQAPVFSLRGKTPLIVVDNIPVETDFYDLSSNDIADITVLKGTSASALYGSRGRNGAILITTKTADKEGLEITLSNRTMFTAGFTVYPETQTQYGNGSNGQYAFWDGQDGGISDGDMIWGPKFEPGKMIPQWNSPIYDNATGESIPWYGDVAGTKYDDQSRYSRTPTPWEQHDNLKDFLGTGIVTNSDFSMAYKSAKFSYRFSGNYSYQKGQVPNTDLSNGGVHFASTAKLANNLTLDSKLSYGKVYSTNYPRYGYGPKNHMYTILIWMGDDVNGQDLDAHQYIPGMEGYRQANYNYAWYNNVYFAAYELTQMYDADIINGQLSLKWDISKDFSVQMRTSAISKNLFEDRKSPKSYLNYGDPRDGDYKTWNSKWLTMDNDLLATYHKQLTSQINLTVNAGAATNYRKYGQDYNATDGIIAPWVYSLSNTKGNVKASTYLRERALRSVYATADVDFYNIFFLTFSGRNDWSSTLPVANNSYFYPSVSLSTLVSNLVTMPKAIDYLKVYGSWASVSSDLDPYQTSSYYTNAGSYDGTTMINYPGDIINPNIKPEKSTSIELGLSTAFLKNKFALDVTYYNVVDENQILDFPITPSTGFSSRKVNGNEYTTNGVEVVLTAKPIRNRNFQWDVLVNWSHHVKKLTKIYGDEEKYNYLSVGERVDNFYTTGWMKSPDGKVILSETTGLPTKDSYPQMMGHQDPDWTFGFTNNFKYKKLSMDIGIDGAVGGVFWSRTIEKMWWGGKHPNSTTWRDAEYAAGEPVYVPDGVNVVSGELVRGVNGEVISDTRVYQDNTTAVSWQTWSQNYPYRARVTEDESSEFANVVSRTFVKLRTVSLTYDATSLFNIKGSKKFEIYAFGYNLLILKKAIIVDPDFGQDNDLQDPSARYLGLGFKFTI